MLPALDVEVRLSRHCRICDIRTQVDPYIGALGIFWDANFNGVLDEGDVNIVDFIDDDYYYDYYDSPSRNHENEGPGGSFK